MRRPSAERHARPGQVVADRYEVRNIIGRGGWSVVYDAVHLGTGQRVALKMLLSGLPCGDDRAEARFAREARVTANLRHPHTVRVFDVGRTPEGVLWHASEFLEGPCLGQVLAEREAAGKVMTPAEAFAIADPILRSLHEAHGMGLVHRDLKPENIVLTEVAGERVLKVLDFGIAWLRGQKITRHGVSLGSPHYMSPEQCARQDVDGRSDLYAVSVLLFRCVTGQLPFNDDDPLAVLELHRSGPAPDPRHLTDQPLPDAFVAALRRGLEKHPMQRFDDAPQMRLALQLAVGATSHDPSRAMSLPSRHIPRADGDGSATRFLGLTDLATPTGLRTDAKVADAPPLPRSTARYGAVTAAVLASHQGDAPALSAPKGGDSSPSAEPTQDATAAAPRGRRLWPAALATVAALLLAALMVLNGQAADPTPNLPAAPGSATAR